MGNFLYFLLTDLVSNQCIMDSFGTSRADSLLSSYASKTFIMSLLNHNLLVIILTSLSDLDNFKLRVNWE